MFVIQGHSILDQTVIDEKLLVETIEYVLNDATVRNLTVFSYALLKKFGISDSEKRNSFPFIGLHSEQSCRESLFKIHNSKFELLSGGII
jgi:hypothetical protein